MKDEFSHHDFVDCHCHNYGCGLCSGKIRLCKKCEGVNQTLTSNCCGYLLSTHQKELVMVGKLNYYQGTWHTNE